MSRSNATVKRDADSALMPPPPPPPSKRIKRAPKVLQQDQYEHGISQIIARDFFPTLLANDAASGYLDARQSGMDEWIEEAENDLRSALRPHRNEKSQYTSLHKHSSAAPETHKSWRGENSWTKTPLDLYQKQRSMPLDAGRNINEASMRTDMRLGAFQANYTSEDNESFHKIIDKQNVKNADRHKWLWNDNKLTTENKIQHTAYKPNSNNLAIAKTEGGMPNSKTRIRPKINDERPARVQVHHANPRNGLMFIPDDSSDEYPGFNSIEHTKQASSRAFPKMINYSATRMEFQNDISNGRSRSPTLSKIDRAIRNRPGHVVSSSRATSTTDSEQGGETPQANGYAYVDAEPSSAELDAHSDLQMTRSKKTYSSPASKPDLLIHLRKIYGEGPEDVLHRFEVQDLTEREMLHDRVLAKQLASNRALTDQRIHQAGHTDRVTEMFSGVKDSHENRRFATPLSKRTGRTSTQDVNSMTPAARMLFNKVEKTAPGRGSLGSEDSIFGRPSKGSEGATPSWTPTTIRARKI